MTRLLIIALIAATGCAGTFGGERRASRTLRAVNVTALVASTAMIAWDACQTHSAAREGWSAGRSEGGNSRVIMGTHPSESTVLTYFASAAAVNVVAWYLIPERWRSVLPGLVVGAQAPTVIGNFRSTTGCNPT